MRFLYATVAMLVWISLIAGFKIYLDSNTLILSLAIIAAGAMAGGD